MPGFLLALGLGSGLLTTIGGVGGGVMMVLVLSLVWTPTEALATSAVALLVGNVHRVALFRKAIDRKVATAFVGGAAPGALLGSLSVVLLPPTLVRGAMAVLTVLAVARHFMRAPPRPPRAALLPLGFGVGLATATAGGGGILAAPVLLSAGITGSTYLATASAASAAMHVTRLAGYSFAGLVTPAVLGNGLVLAGAILAGNALGKRIRDHLGERQSGALELSTLLLCVGLSLAGVGQSMHGP